MERYYVFSYRDNCGGGRRYILAQTKKDALRKLRAFLKKHHPDRKYRIEFDERIEVPAETAEVTR